ncbi:uncharacterized protein LOC126735738 [Anthonomus grandis grandis]|uniref:uncharacterized protein LOC126735738 n=1 Tax=Anthonomus grandis grandis TaxID=2921223 RepID=UPI0021666E14|nr:uncharacterized protein LOC126735738 [Anthonomus grandis grandis]XP_050295781.1 uncharacterized protein LOC126735738 [Anthonomus grandis grandis]
MRLQSGDGLLQAVHNKNNDILNSPKRINTLQNSNYTQNAQNSIYYGNVTTADTANITDNIQQLTIEDVAALTKGQTDTDTEELQWCNSDLTTTGAQTQKLQYDNIQRHLVLNGLSNNRLNINSNLAARLQRLQAQNALNAPFFAQDQDQRMPQSPDDVLIDDYEAHQSCSSSASASPQDEDRAFDPSDSAESSDEGNDYSRPTTADIRPPMKGFVNPNYPGFQHLAHTLNFDEETLNNANNNNEIFEIHDKFDSVNRLDSVENIQKVFHDKSLNLNIDGVTPITPEPLAATPNDVLSISDGSENNDDSCTTVNENFNIRIDEKKVFDSVLNVGENYASDDKAQSSDDSKTDNKSISDVTKSDVIDKESVVGDFRKEVEEEFEKHCSDAADKSKLIQATEQELEETVEKLQTITPLQPIQASSTTNDAPVIIQPSPIVAEKPLVLEDTLIVKSPLKAKAPEVPVTTLQLKKEETLARLSRNSKSKEEKMAQNVAMPMEVDSMISLNACTDQKSIKDRTKPVPSFLPLQENAPRQIEQILSPIENKMADATLSSCQESISKIVVERPKNFLKTHRKMDVDTNETESVQKKMDLSRRDSNRELEEIEIQIKKIKSDTMNHLEEIERFRKEEYTKNFKEKDDDCCSLRKPMIPKTFVKKRRDYNQQFGSLITFPKRENIKRDPLNRRSVPMVRDRRKAHDESLGGFDVYNIETAMPKIDLDAIENHLKAARDEERRRRIDREEIRRRLAMGNEDDYYSDRPGRKPSLQARLQSGMNLQICFMNETVSDNESPSSDNECPLTNPKPTKTSRNNPQLQKSGSGNVLQPAQRPATLALQPAPPPQLGGATSETDFFTKQARLQTEARMALAQAKEMARMQMEIEKQRQKKSPITEMVRNSLEKVGIPFPEEKRRLSRQILTDMNVAQLQVIVNDLHTQIETLNEQLVKFLMNRDDLHMEQDSMLVDIEDLTRYLGAKEQVLKEQQLAPTPQNNNLLPPPSPAPSSPLTTLNNTVRPHLNRIASLVKK